MQLRNPGRHGLEEVDGYTFRKIVGADDTLDDVVAWTVEFLDDDGNARVTFANGESSEVTIDRAGVR